MRAAPCIEVTGPQAQAMNHGLAIRDENGFLFIETAKASGMLSANAEVNTNQGAYNPCNRSRNNMNRTKTVSFKPIFVELPNVAGILTLSESTVQAMVRSGPEHFQQPRLLSGRRVGWLLREIEEWAESRPAATSPSPSAKERLEHPHSRRFIGVATMIYRALQALVSLCCLASSI